MKNHRVTFRADSNRLRRLQRRRVCRLEPLEPRHLLAVSVLAPLADQFFAEDASAPLAIDLAGAFADTAVTGTVVRFDTATPTGVQSFFAEIFDADGERRIRTTPTTATNFLGYVDRGDYDGSFIHRSIPNFVIQGGGFNESGGLVDAVTAGPPIENEPGNSNVRGTLAMAKLGGDPDSATNQWFINLADNSANLDAQNGGFTVFGRVVGDGMSLVDTLAALPTYVFSSPFNDLPLWNYDLQAPPTTENFVRFETIRSLSAAERFTYEVTSSTAAVTAEVLDGKLVLTPAGSPGSSAAITVRAISPFDQTDVSEQTFAVTLLPSTPGVPADVDGIPGDAQVALAWSAPATDGSRPITDYVIQVSSDSGLTWTTFDDGVSATASATVTGLTNGTGYTFRVAAVNQIGQGEFSAATNTAVPEPPPQVFSVPSGAVVTAAVDAGTTRVIKQGLGTLILDRASTHAGGTVVEAGTLVLRDPASVGSGLLRVLPGATVVLDVGTREVALNGLELAETGTLDLAIGSVLITDGGSLDRSGIIALIARDLDKLSGIISSSIEPGSFREIGHRVLPDGALKVGYSAVGDANMDGSVNLQDLIALDAGGKFGTAATDAGWWQGDFNHDGVVNIVDIIAMDAAGLYGTGSYLPVAPQTAAGALASHQLAWAAIASQDDSDSAEEADVSTWRLVAPPA